MKSRTYYASASTYMWSWDNCLGTTSETRITTGPDLPSPLAPRAPRITHMHVSTSGAPVILLSLIYYAMMSAPHMDNSEIKSPTRHANAACPVSPPPSLSCSYQLCIKTPAISTHMA